MLVSTAEAFLFPSLRPNVFKDVMRFSSWKKNSFLNPRKIILQPLPPSLKLCLPHLPHFEVYICDGVQCWCTVDISSGRDEEAPPAPPPPFGPPTRKLATRDDGSHPLLSSDLFSGAAHAVIGSRTTALLSLLKCFVAVLLVWPEVVAGFLAGLVCTIQWPSHLGHQLCAQGGHSWTGELCSIHFVCQKLSSVRFHRFFVVYFSFFLIIVEKFHLITSSKSVWFKAMWAAVFDIV